MRRELMRRVGHLRSDQCKGGDDGVTTPDAAGEGRADPPGLEWREAVLAVVIRWSIRLGAAVVLIVVGVAALNEPARLPGMSKRNCCAAS